MDRFTAETKLLCTPTLPLTCLTLHAGQPAVDVVAHFTERRLDDGCTQNGCGSSDLRVSVVNKAQNVTDVLLLCEGPEVEVTDVPGAAV